MPRPLEFATFHVGQGRNDAVHPNATVKQDQYMVMIGMMIRSAQLFHPGMKAVVLSDDQTDFGALDMPFTRLTRPVNFGQLMYERMLGQLEYLETSNFSMPMVLLDSDILINRPLDPIFSHEFDVALTWRDNKLMPINGGVLVVNNDRPAAGRKFFRAVADRYTSAYRGESGWFGDQLALRDIVGLTVDEMAGKTVIDVNGCRVLLLPCDDYNFSPDNRLSEIGNRFSHEVIIHFKGERKRLMPLYWDAHLAWRSGFPGLPGPRAWAARRQIREGMGLEDAMTVQPGANDD